MVCCLLTTMFVCFATWNLIGYSGVLLSYLIYLYKIIFDRYYKKQRKVMKDVFAFKRA